MNSSISEGHGSNRDDGHGHYIQLTDKFSIDPKIHIIDGKLQSRLSHKVLEKSLSQPSTNTQPSTQIKLQQNYEKTEQTINVGEYLKSGIFGALDGLINTLSLILGGIGASAASSHILLICLAGLIGDGISMGLGDYLSSKSENEYVESQKKREHLQAKNNLQNSQKQMQKFYLQKQYSLEESSRLSNLISSNPEALVNIMMLQQTALGEAEGSPVMNGIVNFLCFTIFGFLPIIPYIIGSFITVNQSNILVSSLIIGGVFLFFLGFIKAWLIGTNCCKSGLTTLVLGSGAVAIGYMIGLIIDT